MILSVIKISRISREICGGNAREFSADQVVFSLKCYGRSGRGGGGDRAIKDGYVAGLSLTFRYPRSAAKCSADRPSLSNTSTRAWLFSMVLTRAMWPLWQAISSGVQPTLDCRFIACCTSDGDMPFNMAVSTSLLPATAQKCNAVSWC